jgi:hypothetical protein
VPAGTASTGRIPILPDRAFVRDNKPTLAEKPLRVTFGDQEHMIESAIPTGPRASSKQRQRRLGLIRQYYYAAREVPAPPDEARQAVRSGPADKNESSHPCDDFRLDRARGC